MTIKERFIKCNLSLLGTALSLRVKPLELYKIIDGNSGINPRVAKKLIKLIESVEKKELEL